MEIIRKEINRLSLNDSHLDSILKFDDILSLEFDWCFLEDYKEKNIHESIILGKTLMKVTGYSSEILRLDYSGTIEFANREAEFITFSQNLIQKNLNVILQNTIDEQNKKFTISGFYEHEGRFCWIDWQFSYDTIELNWNSYITHKDWRNGKLNK